MLNLQKRAFLPAPLFVGHGDSLSTDTWVPLVAALLPTYAGIDLGHPGDQISTMSTDYPILVAPLYNTRRPANIDILWGGTNDSLGHTGAATIQSRITTYVNLAHATGYKVIVMTILPSTGITGADETARVAVNTWIKAGSSGADAYVDIAGVAQAADPANVTYYLDGTHPTTALHTIFAPLIALAITGMGLTVGSLGAPEQGVTTQYGGVVVLNSRRNIKLYPGDGAGEIAIMSKAGAVIGYLRHDDVTGRWLTAINNGAGAVWALKSDETTVFEIQTSGYYGVNTRMGVAATNQLAGIGGSLASDATQTGNVGAGEDTLQTFTLNGNALFVDGAALAVDAAITIANNANAKNVKLYWGGTVFFDSGAITASAAINLIIRCRIERTGAATQRITGTVTSDNATYGNKVINTTGAKTLSGDLIFLMTGTAVADNDIVKNSFRPRFER